jgi:hypothetical protein
VIAPLLEARLSGCSSSTVSIDDVVVVSVFPKLSLSLSLSLSHTHTHTHTHTTETTPRLTHEAAASVSDALPPDHVDIEHDATTVTGPRTLDTLPTCSHHECNALSRFQPPAATLTGAKGYLTGTNTSMSADGLYRWAFTNLHFGQEVTRRPIDRLEASGPLYRLVFGVQHRSVWRVAPSAWSPSCRRASASSITTIRSAYGLLRPQLLDSVPAA